MNQAEIISEWYDALSLSETLEYKLLRNTQTKDGLFTLKKEDKFIMDDTSISNILYFLKGIEYSNDDKIASEANINNDEIQELLTNLKPIMMKFKNY